MMSRWTLATLVMGLAALPMGCRKPVHFPESSIPAAAADAGAVGAYDTTGDGRADFFTFANAGGRINRIGYATGTDGQAGAIVDLDAIRPAQARHLVLILDGLAYDLVRKYYDEGGLRMFHAPGRVVAPYPTMTDLCMEDLFNYLPCRGFESLYFDRKVNRLVGGSAAYLEGHNEPYNRLLQYRASLLWDAIGYLYPAQVFGKELNDAKRIFDAAKTQEMIAYFVSSAGVGTRMGADGQRRSLQQIERLIRQVLHETRGLTKVTLLADHGHSYTPGRRIALEEHLTARGWKLRESLRGDDDVVYVRFGLVTYATFAARRPARLATDLIAAEGVELASYADQGAAVVLGRDGAKAVVRHKAGRFAYEATAGDPLKLKKILASVPADGGGYYDADALLAATATHEYPAPLQRIWRAHFALVENPPDVIVSLADAFYAGSKSFAGSVRVASTHGGLNYTNTVTFVMSTIGPLPKVMRSRDVAGHLARLLGRPWPMKR